MSVGSGLFFKLHMFCTRGVSQEKLLSVYQCCLRFNKTLISQNAGCMRCSGLRCSGSLWDALAWAGRPQKTTLAFDTPAELITISHKSVSVESLHRNLPRTAEKGSDTPQPRTHPLLHTPLSWKSLERGDLGLKGFFIHLPPALWRGTLCICDGSHSLPSLVPQRHTQNRPQSQNVPYAPCPQSKYITQLRVFLKKSLYY